MFYKQLHQSTAASANSQANGSPAKFSLGDRVRWFRVPTQDFGLVCECFYGLESSVQAVGWHYSIQLDPNSPSFAHCKMDYGFEDDLERLEQGKLNEAE